MLGSITSHFRTPLRGLLFLTALSLGSAFFCNIKAVPHWIRRSLAMAPLLVFLLCLLLSRCKFTGDGPFNFRFNAFVVNGNGTAEINRVYLNKNSDGNFTDANARDAVPSDADRSTGVALGDLDGDGNLDAFVANSPLQENRVYLNKNGDGNFTDANARDAAPSDVHQSTGVALGDLDGDGNLDAFVVNGEDTGQINRVYLNKNGDGNFTDANARDAVPSDVHRSTGVALGDLDGDGNLDAFVVNNGQNRVYLNKAGDGDFKDINARTPVSTDAHGSTAIALGDLDGDGNLDAFVVNFNEVNRVYLNKNGDGDFKDINAHTAAPSDAHPSTGVALGDLDGDGNLDAFVVNSTQVNRVYLNDGAGNFTDANAYDAAPSDTNLSRGVALGDLDGDGNLDAFVVNFNQVNRVYLNKNGDGNFTDANARDAAPSDAKGSLGVGLGQF